jgi:hypothetical protein
LPRLRAIPSITERPKDVFKLYLKFTRPITMKLSIFLLVNTLAASWVCYRETVAVHTVNYKLQAIADEFEQEQEQ